MEKDKTELSDKINVLMREVIEDAELRAETKIRQAEEKSKNLIEEVKKNLENEIDEMFEKIGEELNRERETKQLEIQSQIKNQIMIAKDEKIKKVLEIIERELLLFKDKPKYKTFLKETFENMLQFLPPGNYILFLNKEDTKKLSKMDLQNFNKNPGFNFTISQEENIDAHGILLKSEDQRIILEDTLESRFIKKKEKLRSKIANLLFTTK